MILSGAHRLRGKGGGTGPADPAAAGPIISAQHTCSEKCQAETTAFGPMISVNYDMVSEALNTIFTYA